MMAERRILVGITGASGAVYAERFIEELTRKVERIYIVVTDAGKEVLLHELPKPSPDGFSLINILENQISEQHRSIIRVLKNDDFFSPVASGSSVPTDMVVLPCSMGTLGRIAHGLSTNLLERAADVVIKEKKRLVICPRETPLSKIHLQNMLALTDVGATIVPPMPGFYQKPKSVDDMINFVVGRVLESIELKHELYPAWNSRMN